MANRKIMGKNTVEEIIQASKERILTLYTSSKPLFDDYKQQGIHVRLVDRDQLTRLVSSDSHQGVVAEIRERAPLSLAQFLEDNEAKASSVILLLDHIQDPQNFGSILRVADCFGVDLIIYSNQRQVGITPIVSKVSMGASELLPLVAVGNLVETAKQLKEKGYWLTTTELSADAQSVYQFSFPNKWILAMGSEGEGVQKQLSRIADHRLMIPMKGKINSLNVATATSALLALYQSKML